MIELLAICLGVFYLTGCVVTVCGWLAGRKLL
jgi:hypothetical protein